MDARRLTARIYSDRNVEAHISLLSATSQKVADMQRALVKGNNIIQIPIDHLKNGSYFLVINKGNERIVKKVMINK